MLELYLFLEIKVEEKQGVRVAVQFSSSGVTYESYCFFCQETSYFKTLGYFCSFRCTYEGSSPKKCCAYDKTVDY